MCRLTKMAFTTMGSMLSSKWLPIHVIAKNLNPLLHTYNYDCHLSSAIALAMGVSDVILTPIARPIVYMSVGDSGSCGSHTGNSIAAAMAMIWLLWE